MATDQTVGTKKLSPANSRAALRVPYRVDLFDRYVVLHTLAAEVSPEVMFASDGCDSEHGDPNPALLSSSSSHPG